MQTLQNWHSQSDLIVIRSFNVHKNYINIMPIGAARHKTFVRHFRISYPCPKINVCFLKLCPFRSKLIYLYVSWIKSSKLLAYT